MSNSLIAVCSHCSATTPVSERAIGQMKTCSSCEREFEVETVKFVSTHDSAANAGSSQDLLGEPSEPPAEADQAQQNKQRKPKRRLPKRSDEEAAKWKTPPAESKPSQRRAKLEQLGRFQVKSVLGQGAFGRVYRAIDPHLDRDIALKLPTFPRSDERRVQRFLTEARAAASLRHPHIATTFESGDVEGQLYIAVEFVDGAPLSTRLEAGRPHVAQAAMWSEQIARALHYAHREGVVHRDVKPDNVMVDSDDQPRVMDFGLAKRMYSDEQMTVHGGVMGTPAYMAPEQARGDIDNVGPHSDQYSVGVMLYEMLCGRKPFQGSVQSVLADVVDKEPQPPRSLEADVDPDVEAICLKAMKKDPRHRYASLEAMADDLAAWRRGAPTSARRLSLLDRFYRWRKNNAAVAAITLTILAIVAFTALGSVALIVVADAKEAEYRKYEADAKQANEDLAKETKTLVDANALASQQVKTREQRVAELTTIRDGIQRATNDADAARKEINQARSLLEAEEAKTQESRRKIAKDSAETEASLKEANESLYAHLLKSASQFLSEKNYQAANQALSDCSESQRHWEWSYLQEQTRVREWMPPRGKRVAVAQVNAPGTHLVLLIADVAEFQRGGRVAEPGPFEIMVVDASTLRTTFRARSKDAGGALGKAVAISDSGRWAAIVTPHESSLTFWDAKTGKQTQWKSPAGANGNRFRGFWFDGENFRSVVIQGNSGTILTVEPDSLKWTVRQLPKAWRGAAPAMTSRADDVLGVTSKGTSVELSRLEGNKFEKFATLKHPLPVRLARLDESTRFVYTWDQEKFRLWDREGKLLHAHTTDDHPEHLTGHGTRCFVRAGVGLRALNLGELGEAPPPPKPAAAIPERAALRTPPLPLEPFSADTQRARRSYTKLSSGRQPDDLIIRLNSNQRRFDFPKCRAVAESDNWLAVTNAPRRKDRSKKFPGEMQLLDCSREEPRLSSSYDLSAGLAGRMDPGMKTTVSHVALDEASRRFAAMISISPAKPTKDAPPAKYWVRVGDMRTRKLTHTFPVEQAGTLRFHGDLVSCESRAPRTTLWSLRDDKRLLEFDGYGFGLGENSYFSYLTWKRGDDGKTTKASWVLSQLPGGQELARGSAPSRERGLRSRRCLSLDGKDFVLLHYSYSGKPAFLVCVDPSSGETIWESSEFQDVQINKAADMILAWNADGNAVLFEASAGPATAIKVAEELAMGASVRARIDAASNHLLLFWALPVVLDVERQVLMAVDLDTRELVWREESSMIRFLADDEIVMTRRWDERVYLFRISDGPTKSNEIGDLQPAQHREPIISDDHRRMVYHPTAGGMEIWTLVGKPQRLLRLPTYQADKVLEGGALLLTGGRVLRIPNSAEVVAP